MTAVVIGAGPAGLMAADALARDGIPVTLAEAMPTAGRKFLMAGKSGLNLTMDEPLEVFSSRFFEANSRLAPVLSSFGPSDAADWAIGLGQSVFVGSSGRVFPRVMKASPLLRAWLAHLGSLGVTLQTRWIWRGWDGDALRFDTPDGAQTRVSRVTVLALGGASWSRLGANGQWATILQNEGFQVTPFRPSNMGISLTWSEAMHRHFGAPLKPVRLTAGPETKTGECVITAKGLEGSAIYALSRSLRDKVPLFLDLLPDWTPEKIATQLSLPWGKASLSNILRKGLRLPPVKVAIAHELAHPLPKDAAALAKILKALPVRYDGPRPLDEAISVAGGLAWSELDDTLMLKKRHGTFACGEMLDWEAPTGGYLITACLASGLHAGRAAAAMLAR